MAIKGSSGVVNLFFNNLFSLNTICECSINQGNNISDDPLLTGDYHLQDGSPAIDAGFEDVARLPEFDFEGDDRLLGSNVDMGADEFTGETPLPDTTPDAFAFTPVSGAELNSLVESNAVAVTGINAAAPISITGSDYAINDGAWTDQPGTVNNNDSVNVRVTSSSLFNTEVLATLTIGGVDGVFSVTTKEEPIIEEPIPTADAGFKLKGSGGAGSMGWAELLLMLCATVVGAARRQRIAGLIGGAAAIALVGALPVSPVATADSGWYIGVSAGHAESDYGESDLRKDLVARGYGENFTSANVDNEETGWKLFGGYQFTPNWAVEGAYVDLGKIKSTVESTIDSAEIPQLVEDATKDHGYMGQGVALSGVSLWPVHRQWSLFGKLGLFRWDADIEVKDVGSGVRVSRTENGIDAMGGVGVKFLPTSHWEVRGEWERYQVDSDWVEFLTVGAAYRF